MQSKEARLILGAAIVDDILAIAILSVVVTMVQSGNTTPQIMDIAFIILKILGLFAVLLIGWLFFSFQEYYIEKNYGGQKAVSKELQQPFSLVLQVLPPM